MAPALVGAVYYGVSWSDNDYGEIQEYMFDDPKRYNKIIDDKHMFLINLAGKYVEYA